MKTKIQFIKGIDEKIVPDVRLTRSRDGSTGTATFQFQNPTILSNEMSNEGEVTGMYLIDNEGILETKNVYVVYVNGKPRILQSVYIMENPEAWDRFMRFIENYASENGLSFFDPSNKL
uniref:Photosystem II reaction center Psb28 protein n=1 Tax=Astrosyne radiata TaxID=1158023 RepID=A0A2U9NTZ0_9STRA|nr:photosystem II protein W [Astrosyne radiata]AWT40346.1 photosystem II protein W [Astrosyne radiata]|mmetsp:Transcript_32679/g.75231  ORF Transcript_32679/g.75231 Transcript_32679/m.75231 type:complete len:119 (-) Transcript_32679:99-455(-)